jgi:hypothetical protein
MIGLNKTYMIIDSILELGINYISKLYNTIR